MPTWKYRIWLFENKWHVFLLHALLFLALFGAKWQHVHALQEVCFQMCHQHSEYLIMTLVYFKIIFEKADFILQAAAHLCLGTEKRNATATVL